MAGDEIQRLQDFLRDHARFPFPKSDLKNVRNTTVPSMLEADQLDRPWKAEIALRDESLVNTLCATLDNILGDTRPSALEETQLHHCFTPELELDSSHWEKNMLEAKAVVLHMGFIHAAAKYLHVVDKKLVIEEQSSPERYGSEVDLILKVDSSVVALAQAKADNVLSEVGRCLPPHGFCLDWSNSRTLMEKVILEAAIYMASWHTVWLFLTSHNHWIILRFCSDDKRPYLKYSPMFSIEGEIKPFRAFLGALLATANNVNVPSSEVQEDVCLNDIAEDAKLNLDHIPEVPRTLKITLAPPERLERHWFSLQEVDPMSTTALTNNTDEPIFLWLDTILGRGSTGVVREGIWETNIAQDNLIPRAFAVKYVEILSSEHKRKRERLRNEFRIYQILERAYSQCEQPSKRIAPQCFGFFESDLLSMLVLEKHDVALMEWGDLTQAGKIRVFKMAQKLHALGIEHTDLEPRNVVETATGGLSIVDFSGSRVHDCKEKHQVHFALTR
ncbi:hypothetical protein DFH11DRAFT_1607533 [Phellopilus nigrolimitatus]|nr:hypothetical protein DFH11DRAFT_1607533 [Phellopilus nigrolimitatus]